MKSVFSISLAVILLSSMVVVALQADVDAVSREQLRKLIEQRNEAIARQNGGSVAQNQLNAANLNSDNNDLSQSNRAVSEGADSSFQNQENSANIQGDNNNLDQSNDATSDADNSVINQNNNAKVQGDNNNVKQSNNANQESSGEGGSQSATQSNNCC